MAHNEVEYVLTFGNTAVGARLHGIGQPQIQLTQAPKVVHPFWWKRVIVDGRYSAPIYEFPFQVILSEADPLAYLDAVYGLTWMLETDSGTIPTSAHTLSICKISSVSTLVPFGPPSVGVPVMTFGPCFFAGASQQEPSDVMVTNFGIVEVKFMSPQRPILLS
jgi:hypothetical protein